MSIGNKVSYHEWCALVASERLDSNIRMDSVDYGYRACPIRWHRMKLIFVREKWIKTTDKLRVVMRAAWAHETYDRLHEAPIGQGRIILLFIYYNVNASTQLSFVHCHCLALNIEMNWWPSMSATIWRAMATTGILIFMYSIGLNHNNFDAFTSSLIRY